MKLRKFHRTLCKMCAWCKLLLILSCLRVTLGSDQNVSTAIKFATKSSCNATVLKELDECWNNLPPISVHGIPSSPQKIENACSIFVSGMECVDNWSRTCLSKEGQEKIEGSIIGAIQIYKYLCTDDKFRKVYLKHANCYKRISPHWDDCNTKFINTLKRIDHARDTTSLCCIRLKYVQCVNDVTTILCSDVANTFLQSITESLMHSPLQEYHSSLCDNVNQRNCSRSSSSAAFLTKTLMTSRIPFCVGVMCQLKQLMFMFISIFEMYV